MLQLDTYGSAINRSVSLIILLGRAILSLRNRIVDDEVVCVAKFMTAAGGLGSPGLKEEYISRGRIPPRNVSGMCGLSNSLVYLFRHTHLTISY
jgi:hypothetical protein